MAFFEAARLLQRALSEVEPDSPLRVQILITLAYSMLNANETRRAVATAKEAVTRTLRLGQPHSLGMALGMQAILRFINGEGLDDANLRRAVQLEDPDIFTPLVFRPSVQHALLMSWSGQVDEGHRELQAIRRRCVENGEEGELIFIAQHVVLSSIWRGDFGEADLVAEDVMERARQLGGDTPMFLAHGLRAKLAVYAGHEAEARRAISKALEVNRRTGSFGGWVTVSSVRSDSWKCRWATTTPPPRRCSRW